MLDNPTLKDSLLWTRGIKDHFARKTLHCARECLTGYGKDVTRFAISALVGADRRLSALVWILIYSVRYIAFS